MKFGSVPVEESLGGVIAHGVRYKGVNIKKGEIVEPYHMAALKAVGFDQIVIAEFETGDVEENAAALALAETVAGDNVMVEAPATGRVNIYAKQDGIFTLDEAVVNGINDVDERITLATLPPMRHVMAGDMVATVKIIPFSVPETALACAIGAARGAKLSVAAYRALRIGVISTLLPGLKVSVVEKTLNVLAERIAMTPAKIVGGERVMHDVPALAQAIAAIAPSSDIVIIFGASAITDRRDVIPAAIEQCGGHIVHFGMPVDPGNLLLLGALANGKAVIGAPGCARSPKESGFDWVLQRMLAGLPVSSSDIRRMGAGGLLIENDKHRSRQADPLLGTG